ncbi:sensor histidine kinase [Jatrophihabitans fulvus]
MTTAPPRTPVTGRAAAPAVTATPAGPDDAGSAPSAPAASPAPATMTLRRRMSRGSIVLAVVVALLLGTVGVVGGIFAAAGNKVAYQWQPALSWARRVLSDVQDQETGLRGYALTSNPRYLRPYTDGVAAEKSDGETLRQRLGDDPTTERMYERMIEAADDWRSQIAEPAIALIRRGDPAGAQLVASNQALDEFDVIRTRFGTLSAELIERVQDVRAQRAVYGVVFAITGGLLVIVLAGSGALIWRGLRRSVLEPVEALSAQTRAVAEGDVHRGITAVGPGEISALSEDVESMRRRIATELARAESISAELRERGEELARSNEDLQQFAYVASHDLSEPLRKVANFCQLLERQYSEQLDDRARQYIFFAVDGAKRMQALITDLLALSRVGRTTEPFERLDLDAKLDVALGNLGDRLEAAGATVERETPLPSLWGDRALIVSLFENLIGNAVKYRRDDVAPVVRVRADHDAAARSWTFTVSDNGIGIDPQYAERIFVVFQRLHLRDQYGGTGIGLSLCRRIVEFHGGAIWLDSGDGAVQSETTGATFRFTLPEGGGDAEPRDRPTP